MEGRIIEIFASIKRGGSSTPLPSPKSPRDSTTLRSVGSDSLAKPLIIVSGQAGSQPQSHLESESSEEERASSIVDEEPSPLEYYAMRGKLMDTISLRNPSDTESLLAMEGLAITETGNT